MKRILLLLFICSTQSCKIVKTVNDSISFNKSEISFGTDKVCILPFKLKNNKIFVNIKTNESGTEEICLMLDTGAPTILSEKYAREHNLIADSSFATISTPLADKQKVKRFTAQNVTFYLDGIKITKPKLRVLGIKNEILSCNGADGIFGIDILSNFNVVFDFVKEQVLLYDKSTLPADISDYNQVLAFDNYSPLQKIPEISLAANSAEDDFIWDTGFNGSFYIRKKSAKGLNKWRNAYPGAIEYENLGSIADINNHSSVKTMSYLFTIDSLSYAKKLISVNKYRGTALLNPKMKLSRNNIGIAFMKNYKVLISWKEKKIYLKEITASMSPVSFPSLALGYESADSSIMVRAIRVDSKSYARGIRAGDKVTRIDKAEITELLRTNDVCDINTTVNKLIGDAEEVEMLKGDSTLIISMMNL